MSPCRMRSSRCNNIIYSMQVNYSSSKYTLMRHRSQNMWSCLQMIYTSHMHAWMHPPLPCGMNMANWPTLANSRAVSEAVAVYQSVLAQCCPTQPCTVQRGEVTAALNYIIYILCGVVCACVRACECVYIHYCCPCPLQSLQPIHL